MLAVTPLDAREFLPGDLQDEVRGLAPAYHEFDPASGTAATFAQLLHDFDPEVIISGWRTPPLPAVLPPRLRYVCHLTGSVRGMLTRRHLEDGMLVTNWGGSIARVVAEGALMHVLASLRRTTHWALAMHRGAAWKAREDMTASLFGRRVGLHGFGRVARELIALLAPFDVRISVFAPDMDSAAERAYGIRRADSLAALFSENDVVVELAPLNAQTEGIITGELLRLLRPGCVFVNTGRGRVVDEAALVAVAREGKVLFGLDVFAAEPLAADHPLRGLPNVTLTPHQSGPTTDRRRDSGAHAVSNLRAYAAGEPLDAIVTPELYDLSS
jgi:phosphoglycerate dehydrogenase-like enzyme